MDRSAVDVGLCVGGTCVGQSVVDGGHCVLSVGVDRSAVDVGLYSGGVYVGQSGVDVGLCIGGTRVDRSVVDGGLYGSGSGGSTADVDSVPTAVAVAVSVTVTAGDAGNKTAKAPGALAAAQRDIASDRARWSGDRPHARVPAPFSPPFGRSSCGGAVLGETSGCW